MVAEFIIIKLFTHTRTRTRTRTETNMFTKNLKGSFYCIIFLLLIYPSYVSPNQWKDRRLSYFKESEATKKNEAAPKFNFQKGVLISESSRDRVSNLSNGDYFIRNDNQCDTDEANVKIKISTDDWPDQSSWSLVDLSENNLIRDGGSYSKGNKIYEDQFCLKPGNFNFIMSDSWGDGLCPNWSNSEYCGFYEVSVNGVVADSGSSFGYERERFFSVCTIDDQCDDLNDCTTDSCYKNLCVHEKLECSECGGNHVAISIKTDDWAYQTTWDVRNSNTGSILRSGGAYDKNNNIFTDNFCLAQGYYEFAIYDSYGDGICPTWSSVCGHYEVSVNNVTALSGSAFSEEQRKEFIICDTDDQCADDNPCTTDFCQNNVCTNEQLPCSECEGRNITISIQTDDRPHHSTWEMRYDATNTKVRSGGAYSKAEHLYTDSFCLSSGKYTFDMFDYWGDGLCRDDNIASSCGYYEVRIDDAVAVKGGGGFWNTISKKVTICSVDSDCDDHNPCTSDTCNLESKQCTHRTVESETCGIFGNRTALAIRVNAMDSSMTYSLDDISNHVFGTFGESSSMSSQFNACSYNMFNILPFSGRTSTNFYIPHGVVEINIDENVKGESAQTVTDKVLLLANDLLGNVQDQFDFVLVCLPPGTQTGSYNWKGFAFLSSYLSVYNDKNCVYLSVLMHEIGHNLGLGHSNDDRTYGDETCVMGASYEEIGGPHKCFNAAKSWQLGWYREAESVIDLKAPKEDGSLWFGVVGVSDYNKRETWMSTIIKIINSNDGFDYYLSFNSNSDMNSGTTDGINEVLITRSRTGHANADSFLIEKLDSLQRFQLLGEDLNIYPYPQVDTNPSYAGVQILRSSSESNEDECHNDQSLLSVQVRTNDFPSSVNWNVQSIETGEILMSSGYYSDPKTIHTSRSCIGDGHYSFSISYEENNNSTVDTEYNLTVEDVIVDQGNSSEITDSLMFFAKCSSDNDCNDFDGEISFQINFNTFLNL